MEVPGLGTLTEDPRLGWYRSEPVPIPVLGGSACRVILEDYESDPDPEQLHAAIRAFLSAGPSVLRAAEPYIYAYYQDCRRDGATELELRAPGEVWEHVQLGDEPVFSREDGDPEHVYVSLECECGWEIEHGLQIVFEDGLRVSRISPFDGDLTNARAWGDERLRGVVYTRAGEVPAGPPPAPAERRPWWKPWG